MNSYQLDQNSKQLQCPRTMAIANDGDNGFDAAQESETAKQLASMQSSHEAGDADHSIQLLPVQRFRDRSMCKNQRRRAPSESFVHKIFFAVLAAICLSLALADDPSLSRMCSKYASEISCKSW